jgi:hypothetical protein
LIIVQDDAQLAQLFFEDLVLGTQVAAIDPAGKNHDQQLPIAGRQTWFDRSIREKSVVSVVKEQPATRAMAVLD